MNTYPPSVPLAVDLDGTLSKSDNLVDALTLVALRSPKHIPAILRAIIGGRLELKRQLVEIGAYRPGVAPLREDFVDYLREQKQRGRLLHLVTASPQPVADEMAERVGIFDSASGSRDGVNLKGAAKADHLQRRFPEGFAYAGNDSADLHVWRLARGAITVGAPAYVQRAVNAMGIPVEKTFPRAKAGLRSWLRLLRIHQWSKNTLLFIPLFLAHRYDDPSAFVSVALGFLCIGLVASATYIVNDLADLNADRRHETKRYRPMAAAEISVGQGLVVAAVLGLMGMWGALLLDRWFAATLLVYVLLTLAYSLRLKAIALLDVFVLGILYTLRIVMGLVLLKTSASPWLLVFSLFFFFSLSVAKRHVEIVRASKRFDRGRVPGRGYEVTDMPLTLALGVSTSSLAVLLLFLYVANDAYPLNMYTTPAWLWAISPIVFLWSARIWLKSHRGKLDDDPINFALRDPPSLMLGAGAAICFFMAVR